MRNIKKETEWDRQIYKRYTFKLRKDNGDNDKFVAVLNGRPFSEWAKEHIEKDYKEMQGNEE